MPWQQEDKRNNRLMTSHTKAIRIKQSKFTGIAVPLIGSAAERVDAKILVSKVVGRLTSTRRLLWVRSSSPAPVPTRSQKGWICAGKILLQLRRRPFPIQQPPSSSSSSTRSFDPSRPSSQRSFVSSSNTSSQRSFKLRGSNVSTWFHH